MIHLILFQLLISRNDKTRGLYSVPCDYCFKAVTLVNWTGRSILPQVVWDSANVALKLPLKPPTGGSLGPHKLGLRCNYSSEQLMQASLSMHTEIDGCGNGDSIHYNDTIMSAIASQTTDVSFVYSAVYSSATERQHQTPRHWPLWGEITGDRWIPRTKGQ